MDAYHGALIVGVVLMGVWAIVEMTLGDRAWRQAKKSARCCQQSEQKLAECQRYLHDCGERAEQQAGVIRQLEERQQRLTTSEAVEREARIAVEKQARELGLELAECREDRDDLRDEVLRVHGRLTEVRAALERGEPESVAASVPEAAPAGEDVTAFVLRACRSMPAHLHAENWNLGNVNEFLKPGE